MVGLLVQLGPYLGVISIVTDFLKLETLAKGSFRVHLELVV